MASRPENSRRRLAAALAVSCAFHAALLLAYALTRETPQSPVPALDTHVALDGLQLSLITWNEPPRAKGAAEEQEFKVSVGQELSKPFQEDSGPAPVVVPQAAPGSGGPGGGGKTGERGKGGEAASFFRVLLKARRIVFALDCSLSMGLDRSFGRAREEVLRCLRALPEGASFRVIIYNASAEALPDGGERLLPAEEGAIGLVEKALNEARPEGGTDHQQALQLALSFDPEVIFLVTDADDLTLPQVRDITRINRTHAAIHTIDVSRRLRAAGMLQELARQNGGLHVRAP